MSDLISRCELFNRLATIPASPEANDLKAQIYAVIQSMETVEEEKKTEKGCDNCYYTYFDEKAYPCSLCIRGVERTDMWQGID